MLKREYVSHRGQCVITLQAFCTVLNSSYDLGICSCDEQISVFDTCVSKYPCLRVYVSYVITAPSTPSQPHTPPPEQNSSLLLTSDDNHEDRRRQQRRSDSLEAPVMDYSATSTGGPSDVRQQAKVTDPEVHYDGVENKPSSLNASLDGDYIPTLVSTESSATSQDNNSHPDATKYHFNLDQLSGNGSEPMVSYHMANDSRQASTDYDSRDLTTITTADVNRSYVAQLYRSWDDSFLPQVHFLLCTQPRI